MTARDSAAATYDAANKITLSGFAYDGDGNLTGDGASAYAWDDRGDMTGRTGGGMTTSYGYDARGLRVVSQVGLGTKTFYVFAGDTLVGEVNGAGVAQAAYTWGAAGLVSERLVPTNKSLWYHFGPQGETRQLTDGAGSVADAYVYSAYGQPISSTGTDANPFGFGGKYGCYTDAGTGLVLCTRRWYDSNSARWLSRDPLGYEGGDNLYGYVGNNPVNEIDPYGLWSVRIGVGILGTIPILGPFGPGGGGDVGIVFGDKGIGLFGSGFGGIGIGAGISAGVTLGYDPNPMETGFHGRKTWNLNGFTDFGPGGSFEVSTPRGGGGFPGIGGWRGTGPFQLPAHLGGKLRPSGGAGAGVIFGPGVEGTAVMPWWHLPPHDNGYGSGPVHGDEPPGDPSGACSNVGQYMH